MIRTMPMVLPLLSFSAGKTVVPEELSNVTEEDIRRWYPIAVNNQTMDGREKKAIDVYIGYLNSDKRRHGHLITAIGAMNNLLPGRDRLHYGDDYKENIPVLGKMAANLAKKLFHLHD